MIDINYLREQKINIEDAWDSLISQVEMRWAKARSAAIVNSFGFGGSGVFLLPQSSAFAGESVVGTARHVIVQCLASGEMTVGACMTSGHRSSYHTTVISSMQRDFAVIILPEVKAPHKVVRVRKIEQETIHNGSKVLLCGLPAALRTGKTDTLNKTIERAFVVCFSSRTTRLALGSVDVPITRPSGLPKKLGGMSGGAAYVANGCRRVLYGVIIHQAFIDERIVTIECSNELAAAACLHNNVRNKMSISTYPTVELLIIGHFKLDPSISFAGEVRSGGPSEFPYLLRIGRTSQVSASLVPPDLSKVNVLYSVFLQSDRAYEDHMDLRIAIDNLFSDSDLCTDYIDLPK